jgi:hypothetical protein
MEFIQTAETTLIFGGAAYLLWTFRGLIFPAQEVVEKFANTIGNAAEQYIDIAGDAWADLPLYSKATRATIDGVFGSKEEKDRAGIEFMNDLRKRKEEGDAFVSAVDSFDKLIGGGGIGEAQYLTLLEQEKPMFEFGDDVHPKLLKMRIWLGATMRNNRESITSWNIVLEREKKSHKPSLTTDLVGFQASVEKQIANIEDAVMQYYNSPTTPYALARDGKTRLGGINERFNQPASDVYFNKVDIFWNDSDFSSYIKLYVSQPTEENNLVFEAVETGEKLYIGLAGALDDLYNEWREEWKKDKELAKKHMVDALNVIDIPDTYFEKITSKNKSRNEEDFLKFYGIGFEYMGGSIHFKDTPNTARETTDREKTAGGQLHKTTNRLGKKIKIGHFR